MKEKMMLSGLRSDFGTKCHFCHYLQDLLENGLAAKNMAMLGLGDIVIPGIFVALLLRYT